MTSQVLAHLEAGQRMEAPQDCPPSVYALMTETWLSEPNDRPSFIQILQKLQALAKDKNVRSFTSTSNLAAGTADSDAYDNIFDDETV